MPKKISGASIDIWNQPCSRALNWFFEHPDLRIGLNDLSARLGIAKATAKKIVLQLVSEKFLSIEEIGRVWQIKCNKAHPYNITRKIGHNLILVYESGILPAVHQAVPGAKSVILFGSYRKGDDTDKSDIDIAAEIAGKGPPRIIELGTIGQLGYRNNVKVNLFIFSRDNVDINLFSNISNGIVLEGFLEVRP